MPRFPSSTAIVAACVLLTASAASAAPKDDVSAAVGKLAAASSYTFTTTTEGSAGPGACTGKVDAGGYTSLVLPARDDVVNAVRKGDRVVVQTPDGWRTPDEMKDAPRPQRTAALVARDLPTPAEDATALLADAATVVRAGDGTYTADLPEAAAKKWVPMLRAPRRPAGAAAPAGPPVKDAKASVTFTLSDGSLAKMTLHVSGTVTRGGNGRDVDRTITTEITDVYKTTPDVPPEAEAKLDAAPTTKP